jgi:hypothetical protein
MLDTNKTTHTNKYFRLRMSFLQEIIRGRALVARSFRDHLKNAITSPCGFAQRQHGVCDC